MEIVELAYASGKEFDGVLKAPTSGAQDSLRVCALVDVCQSAGIFKEHVNPKTAAMCGW